MIGFVTALAAFALAAPDAASCGECHVPEYRQWRTSRHAVASTNAVFWASWTHWPNGWCLECHAPDEAQQVSLLGHPARAGILQRIPDPLPDGRWEDGVDCAACHLRDGVVLTAGTPSETALEVHAMRKDSSLSGDSLCARCHEFPFQNHTPRLPFSYSDVLAQSTVSEWRQSSAHRRGTGCRDCHMADHGHAFPGAHDADFVRSAIEVQATRDEAALVLRVSAPGVGHAFPSGDPFRRLELWLCHDEDCADPRVASTFRRTLQKTPASWTYDADLRVPVDGVREVRASLEDARYWSLVMRYGDRRFEADLPGSEVGYPLAAGPVPSR